MGFSTSKQLNAVNDNSLQLQKKYGHKQKDELMVYGYIHQEINDYLNIFPVALIDLCFLFYHVKCQVLKWSKICKTQQLELADNHSCIVDQQLLGKKQKLRGYKYALCDTNPVKTGIVCWRLQIKNPSRYWYSTCIAKPNKQYPNHGTSKHNVYGVGTDPNWYPYHRISSSAYENHSGNWGHPNKNITSNGKCIYHIDMLFDADNGILQFCILEDKTRHAKIWGIPIDKDGDGYVPHFNTISVKHCQIRIANIHSQTYGEQIDDIF